MTTNRRQLMKFSSAAATVAAVPSYGRMVRSRVMRSIVFTLAFLSGFTIGVAASMQSALAQEERDGSADETFLTQDNLFGDWGGLRSVLSDYGISTELTFTTVFAGVFQGDTRDKGPDFGHRVDAFVGADTEKMGLRPGGSFQVHLESRFGDAADRQFSRTGGLFPANSLITTPFGDPGRLVATSLYYRNRLGQRGFVMLGKINALDLLANDPFFGGWGRDRFSNIAFVAPPSGVVPPVLMGAIASYRTAPVT